MFSASVVPLALGSIAAILCAGADEEIESVLAGAIAVVCFLVALCLAPTAVQLLALVLCLLWHRR
ncbi:hypothetical protein AY599_25080 [Leptolyngbya valderiana BDU 20041]|nr:hypothetical protein AY599_25080 [Leptolyngbya valderiana BDU 20041]